MIVFILSYVKCFAKAKICGVVFVHNNLVFGTFVARIDIFFHRGFNASFFECHMCVEFVLAVSQKGISPSTSFFPSLVKRIFLNSHSIQDG